MSRKEQEYDIFVSYRRTASESAGLIVEKLRSMGYRIFFDVESMRSGKFNEQLYNVIQECTDFVIVLPENALDRCNDEDDWVRKETLEALSSNKNIVPVMLRGFTWPSPMPYGMEELQNYQAVVSSPEFFDLAIQRLASYLKSRPHAAIWKKRKRRAATFGTILAALFLSIFILRQIAVPACSEVSTMVANHLSTTDMIMDINNDLNGLWNSFLHENEMGRWDFASLAKDFSDDLDAQEKDLNKLESASRMMKFESNPIKTVLLLSRGVLGMEMKMLDFSMQEEFDNERNLIENMRTVAGSEDDFNENSKKFVNMEFNFVRHSENVFFYQCMELLSRMPARANKEYDSMAPYWRNLPKGVGLEHSSKEYEQFCMNEIHSMERITDEMSAMNTNLQQKLNDAIRERDAQYSFYDSVYASKLPSFNISPSNTVSENWFHMISIASILKVHTLCKDEDLETGFSTKTVDRMIDKVQKDLETRIDSMILVYPATDVIMLPLKRYYSEAVTGRVPFGGLLVVEFEAGKTHSLLKQGDIVCRIDDKEVYDLEQLTSLQKKKPSGKAEFYRLEDGLFKLHSAKMPADDCGVVFYPITVNGE